MKGIVVQADWSELMPLTAEGIKKVPAKSAGVYRLSRADEGQRPEIFHYAEADDLRAALRKHLQKAERNKVVRENVERGDCTFRVCAVEGRAERDVVFRAMWDRYGPPNA